MKKEINNRRRILGIILLSIVLICAIIFVIDKYSAGLNIFYNNADTSPATISHAQEEDDSGSSGSSGNGGSGSSTTSQQTTSVKVSPTSQIVSCPSPSLSSNEVEKIKQAILGSDFIKDLPKNGVISLTFFTFCNGNRIWQNNFLIGKNQILSSGTPDIYLTLHSKYISQFNGNNLCDVIKSANANGDLGSYSDLSDTKLMLKYSGLLKYRDCFGI